MGPADSKKGPQFLALFAYKRDAVRISSSGYTSSFWKLLGKCCWKHRLCMLHGVSGKFSMRPRLLEMLTRPGKAYLCCLCAYFCTSPVPCRAVPVAPHRAHTPQHTANAASGATGAARTPGARCIRAGMPLHFGPARPTFCAAPRRPYSIGIHARPRKPPLGAPQRA